MFFSYSFLMGFSKLVPKDLLGRLAGADFLQQIGKNLKARCTHMPELAFMKIVNRLVERFQKPECSWRDTRLHDAAVVALAHPSNQPPLFEAVEKAGHVRVVGNHAVPDAAAGQTFGLGAAQNTQYIVLGGGTPRTFQELFRFRA